MTLSNSLPSSINEIFYGFGGDAADPCPEYARDVEIAKILIENKADVNVKINQNQPSALEAACAEGKYCLAKYYIETAKVKMTVE